MQRMGMVMGLKPEKWTNMSACMQRCAAKDEVFHHAGTPFWQRIAHGTPVLIGDTIRTRTMITAKEDDAKRSAPRAGRRAGGSRRPTRRGGACGRAYLRD